MKTTKILLLFFSLFFSQSSLLSQTNEGINYKAIIKDANGNILSNQAVQIEFKVVYGVAESIAYHETHSTATDVNGLINVVIGEGTLIDDADFETIGEVQWQFETHYLNVQIDSGNGYEDFGTIQFGAVPYALHAKFADNAFSGNYNDLSNTPTIAVPTGLEQITEDGNTGYRLVGRDQNDYGNIGSNAVDLSFSNSGFLDFGATGDVSVALGAFTVASGVAATALGNGTTASGDYSTATGAENNASGDYSTAMGYFTNASGFGSTALGYVTNASGFASISLGSATDATGNRSTAMGYFSKAPSFAETVLGTHNLEYIPNSIESWNDNDRLFVVGNGTDSSNKSNALTLLKDGRLYIKRKNSNDPNLILEGISNTTAGDNCIITSDPAYAGSDLFLRSYDAVVIELDYDDNETGQFEIKNGAGTNIFEVEENGNATLSGSLTQNSDRRLKKNIEDLPYGLEAVLQLQPKAYNWKDNEQNKKSLGLIAQDVQHIIREIVNQQDDTAKTLGISYTELIPVLIKAIQEQQLIIESQKRSLKKEKSINQTQSEQFEAILKRVEALENGQSN